MKTPSRKRAPKSLPPAVSDLVAEGGNILASDDSTKLAVTPAGIAGKPQAKRRPVATDRLNRPKAASRLIVFKGDFP